MTQVPAPILLPGDSGSVEQLTRIESMFENAERELNARLFDILTRGPEWYREEARLRRLLDAAHASMSDIAAALDEPSLQAGLGEIYATGASEQSGVLGQAFQWAQPHVGAVDRIARDTFGDLLQATAYVEESAKGIIRQAAKLATGSKLTAGKTAVQAGANLAAELRKSGIGIVTYRNGARHGVGEYSKMVLRTKTAVAYNVGTLNHSVSAGVRVFEILDGSLCGLTEHNDPTLANGMIVTAEFAAAYPIAHPNCRRTFGPRPDVPKADDLPKFDPSTTAAQRADQAAFEQFLRDQQRATRNRVARSARNSSSPTSTTAAKTVAPKATRTPRVPRAEVAAPVENIVPPKPGQAWLDSLSEGDRNRITSILGDPSILQQEEGISPVLDEAKGLLDHAPIAGSHAFVGVNYEGLDTDTLKFVADKRAGNALTFDARTTAKASVGELPEGTNLVLSFEKKQGSLGRLVGDDVLVDRGKWEIRAVEIIDDKVVLHLDDLVSIADEAPNALGSGKFLNFSGVSEFKPTNPDSHLLSVKWGDDITPPGGLFNVGGTRGDSTWADFRIDGFEPVVLYDGTVAQHLVDRDIALSKEAVATKLRDDAKVLRPAIDSIDYRPNVLQDIAKEAYKRGYDAVEFGRGSGTVVLRESALAREAAKHEITTAGMRGIQTVEAADMRVSEVDAALRKKADETLRGIVREDAARFGYEGERGAVSGAPDVTDFSSYAAGGMKQLHEEKLAADIGGRLDEIPGLREYVEKSLITGNRDSRAAEYVSTLNARARVRITNNYSAVGQYVDSYGKMTLSGMARAEGFSTPDEFVLARVADNVAVLKRTITDPVELDRLVLDEQVQFIRHFEANTARVTALDLSEEQLARLGWPSEAEAALERRFARITDGWAGTSGDSTPSAVALQVVASEKFGVSTESMWKGLDAMHDSSAYGRYPGGAAGFRKEVEVLISTEGPVLEAYLDASYNLTQQILAEKGVDEAVFVRGMTFGGSGSPAVPEAIASMKGPTPFEMATGKPGPVPPDSSYSASVGYGETKVVQAIGNPLQSWSTVPAVSERFARGGEVGVLMQAKVGAGRILAFPATGPGCLSEFEWVLIGVDDVPVTLSRIK